MFQIIRLELGGNGDVIYREPLHPEYELLKDAMALAEFDAMRCEDYGYDGDLNCWWGRDGSRTYRFVIIRNGPPAGRN